MNHNNNIYYDNNLGMFASCSTKWDDMSNSYIDSNIADKYKCCLNYCKKYYSSCNKFCSNHFHKYNNNKHNCILTCEDIQKICSGNCSIISKQFNNHEK